MSGGVEELDRYIQLHSAGKLACRVDQYKGRITVARVPVEAGQVILQEHQLATIAEPNDNWLYDRFQQWHETDEWELLAMWSWAACALILSDQELASLDRSIPSEKALADLPFPRYDQETKAKLLLLFSPPVTEESLSVDIISCQQRLTALITNAAGEAGLTETVTRLLDVEKLQRYANTWIFNCFEGSAEPLSFVTYFAPAFSSHSCLPNTLWHTDNEVYTLVARKAIAVGEEISFTYTSDGHLLEPTADRRRDLEITKFFVCRCERCLFPCDLSRGFRCQICHRGQWFQPTEGPMLAEGEATDLELERWLDVENDCEGEYLEEYLTNLKIDALYQVNKTCRQTGELSEYVKRNVRPQVCTACGAVPGPQEVERAQVLEYLLSSLTQKEDGEERVLLASVTDAWAEQKDSGLSAGEWWSRISLRCKIMPSMLRYVGNNYVLTSIFDWRKNQLAEEHGQLALALLYVEARHVMVTQMCPLFTGTTAWTSTDMVELICSWYHADAARVRSTQLARDARLWLHLEVALSVGRTIFGKSSFTEDIETTLRTSLTRLLGGSAESDGLVRAKAASVGLALEA